LAPPRYAAAIVLTATCAQMLGKTTLYLAARGSLRLRGRRAERVQRALDRIQVRPATSDALVLASASVGVPSFYLVSIASRAARVDFTRFLVLGTCGRALRFSAIIAVPIVLRFLMH